MNRAFAIKLRRITIEPHARMVFDIFRFSLNTQASHINIIGRTNRVPGRMFKDSVREIKPKIT